MEGTHMNMVMVHARILGTVLILAAASQFAPTAVAADAPARKGDLWESTSQMSMEGMPMQMPANTQQICAAKDSKEPPGAQGAQGNCKNSNYQRDGNKVTWAVQCSGPDMTGLGALVYDTKSSYSGAIKFQSAQRNMTIKLSGRKLGECDNPQ
jgi:Protein of unknown function (DUF3617)